MKTRALWLNVILLLTLLLPGQLSRPKAAALPEDLHLATGPITTDGPPQPPVSPPFSINSAPVSTNLATAPLKAVLLVGPIDGAQGSWTLREIANMELAANVLIANGVTVHRFYPGDGSTFADIETAATGAHFLLYRGHGVYDGTMPSPNVGGFSLSSGYYSPSRIRSNLHLAPHAIVMLYGCFTAGSSSASGDLRDIGIDEAVRRIAQYSDPFFDIGAGGYYANWFGNAFEQFLSYLFAGQTLGQAYESYFDFNPNTVHRTMHPQHPNLVLWSDKDNWDYWQYNNAFSGLPNYTLEQLFPATTLGGIPESVNFIAQVEDTVTLIPSVYTVTPNNSSGTETLSWSLSQQGNWFTLAPLAGTTPQSFTITPTAFATDRPGSYTGVVTVTSTAEVNPVQRINVHLEVQAPQLGGIPESIQFVYSIVTEQFLTPAFTLTPTNTGSSAALTWEVVTEGDWLLSSTHNGITPQSFTLTASGFDTQTVATYQGVLTVTATAAAPVHQSPRVVPVSLHVIDRPFSYIYLPLIMRNAAR